MTIKLVQHNAKYFDWYFGITYIRQIIDFVSVREYWIEKPIIFSWLQFIGLKTKKENEKKLVALYYLGEHFLLSE